MSDEEPVPIPLVSGIDYASPRVSGLPTRLRVIGLISLLLSTILLIVSVGLTAIFGVSAKRAHDQVVGLPGLIVSMNAANAANAARQGLMVAQLRAAAAARANRPKPRALTADEAAHIVNIIQSQLRVPLMAAQSQTLTSELQKPNQEWVDPTLTISTSRVAMRGAPPWQVVLADTGGRGDCMGFRIMILRRYGSRSDQEGTTIELSVDGSFRERVTSIAQKLAMMQRMPIAPSMPLNYSAQLHTNEIAFLAAAIVAGGEILVAAELLIAAILTFRNRQRWMFHHRVYVWGQLVLVLAVAVLWGWAPGFGVGGMHMDFPGVAVIFCLMVYPVVLLCVLPGRVEME